MTQSPWSKQTSDQWFLGLFVVSTVLCVYLLSPYLYVLSAAAALVVVTWPLYQRVLDRVGQQRIPAALITGAVLFFMVFGPLSTVAYLFAVEAVSVAQVGVNWVQGDGLGATVQEARALRQHPWVLQVLAWLPAEFAQTLERTDPLGTLLGPLQSAAVSALNRLSSAVPDLIGGAVNAGIDAMIFVFAVFTFFMEGPALVGFAKKISPIDDAYEDRLFAVFAEFANNMVVASLVTAGLQGVVASAGYAIAGADRAIFLGILTAIFSFIPFVGTGLVWVPVAAVVGWESGLGWAAFVAAWSIGCTGTVDNLVKPMLLRGGADIHPLLVFLSVFGGMAWLGVPGALVGPLLISMFLAMYTIYCVDFLGEARHDAGPAGPGLLERARAWWAGPPGAPLAEAAAPPPSPDQAEPPPAEVSEPPAP